MKSTYRNVLAVLLAVLLLFEAGGYTGVAYAAEKIDKALNPAEQIALSHPEKYQDGENWVFIAQADWSVSEKSDDTLYIPIQRAGDLNAEAEVILKVFDLSAKHDVNYTVELYKDQTKPTILYNDVSIKDLVLDEDSVKEEFEPSDEDELGELIYKLGGAELVDGEGNVVSTVTATPLDENGNPISGTPSAQNNAEAEVVPDQVEETDWTPVKSDFLSPTAALRAARDAYTGTTSDRQALSGSGLTDLTKSIANMMTTEEYDQALADATVEDYPGKEYRLHFNPGEEAKYLVIKPLYSDAAEGDAQVMLLLKDPSENYAIGEDVNPVSITIVDEDEPEAVVIGMAAQTVTAKDGKAVITVNRQGRLNTMKGVLVSTWDGSAVEGDEYSGVGAKLWFPLGIQSRSIEIPVYHGTEEKDFYVTLTALTDETIDNATVHVVIPAAEAVPETKETRDEELSAQRPHTDPIDVSTGKFYGYSGGFDSESAVHLSTEIDEEDSWSRFEISTAKYGYAYDGLYVSYDIYVSWCDAAVTLIKDSTAKVRREYDDGGKHNGQNVSAFWGGTWAPASMSIQGTNIDNEGAVWTDSYLSIWAQEFSLIKRQFTVRVESAELKPLLGMSDVQLREYEAVILDNSTYSVRTLWTDDSFSLTAKDTKSPLRLAGVEAKVSDDEWIRIATIDGSSDTAVVVMDQELINKLAGKNAISWSENGTGNGGPSYKGELTVRPVFDYIDVTVELKPGEYGTLQASAPIASDADDANVSSQDQSSGTVSAPGVYTYHLGDILTFSTEINQAGTANRMYADGVKRELRTSAASGRLYNSGTEHYLNNNGSLQVALTGRDSSGSVVDHPYYSFRPTFTQLENQIRVLVSEEDFGLFNLETGLFAEGNYVSVEQENGDYIYVIDKNILTNDIYQLDAVPLEFANRTPKWTTPEGEVYYGLSFYLISNPRVTENTYRLEAAEADELTWAVLSGTIGSSTMNLTSGRSAEDLNLVQGAMVTQGRTGTVTDENGKFSLPAILCGVGGKVRLLVTYNGLSSIQEAVIPGANAPKTQAVSLQTQQVQAVRANQGLIRVDTYNENGAHVTSVSASQVGILEGALHTLTMNGKQLTVTIKVAPGGEYTFENQVYTEQIKDITVFFKSSITGMTHGSYSSNDTPAPTSPVQWAWNAETGEFVLSFPQFNPDHPEEWTYGDVLMVQITTDRRSLGHGEGAVMLYDAVSTGYAITADPSYQPVTFEYNLDNLAEMLQVTPKTDEDGNPLRDGDTRYSYGNFPYIGEITAAIRVFSVLTSSTTYSSEVQAITADLDQMADSAAGGEDPDLGEDDDGDYNPADDGLSKTASFTKVKLNVFFQTKNTFYGGVRFMFGVVASIGGGSGYTTQKNPFHSIATIRQNNADWAEINELESQTDKIVEGSAWRGAFETRNKSNLGGPYFTFSVYLGAYLDYGYIEISKDGGTEKSHEMVFMGAGGFIGFNGNLGFVVYIFPFGIPMYFNVEAGAKVTCFLGAEGDPNKTLTHMQETNELKGQDFGFNFEFTGRIYVTGNFGVGFYKLIGARISATVAFEAGYSMKIPEWFPEQFDTGWGYISEATFTGTIDLFITSIDLYSATWPLPLADGYLYYFQEVRRANMAISYVESGLAAGKGSEEDRTLLRSRIESLKEMIDDVSVTAEELNTAALSLASTAWHADVISWVAKNRVAMNKQGGIVGSVIDGVLNTKNTGSGISFHTNSHVKSNWVADENQVKAAYGVASSKQLVENAYAQPSSRLLSLGGNKFLMVFLDDTQGRDAMMAATLKWTVYDANNDTWTEPVTVQNDATADGKPNLVDAGNKAILSWTSISDEKYQALKAAVAAEQCVDADSPVVLEALEADPARVMAAMDIFTVEIDKEHLTFGSITQLTDDDMYDDCPLAVYDSETGDYIVLYYKTAQDSRSYKDSGDKLLDLISANTDPSETYSVVAYMLYNNQTSALDTQGNTHEAGWARDYYFPNETAESLEDQAVSLALWGGQRFLASTILTEEGQYADPPISDLTAAVGYNGLAAYAFTVDLDFNGDTGEDRALYVQFYDFASHSTYVPIRVGGSVTETSQVYNSETLSFETVRTERHVEVGTPKLIRNGGNTFLFWRQDSNSLQYLNISELLNVKVAAVENPDPDTETDWTWAVQADGTFATDAVLGETYQPKVYKVDFSSYMTESDMEITEYEVITDEDDNLYVVWTDTVTQSYTDEMGSTYPVAALEIFATAMLRQEADQDGAGTTRWSKPYRMTRNNAFNDGLALAVDESGSLLIIHNQYTKETAESEEEMMSLINEGKIGLTQGAEGKVYAASLSYNSPISLMATRFEKVGSLEATAFLYSDAYPVPGETVNVSLVIENVGLTDAKGCQIEVYETKDGVRGEKLAEFSTEETIQVNTAQTVQFKWTVPEDGPEGYSIEALVREGKDEDTWYDASDCISEPFAKQVSYTGSVTEAVQNGDLFSLTYQIQNHGNADALEGTTLSLRLSGLHGDLNSERYGYLESNELFNKDVTDQLGPKAILEETIQVEIPASVFKYCGYDAVQLVLLDENGSVILESDQLLLNMSEPMHLTLNDGQDLRLESQQSVQVCLSYETNVFLEEGDVVYSVEDPSVACVDENGNVTGLKIGATNLTATLLPSGRTVSIRVKVGPAPEDCPQDEDCLMSEFSDLDPAAWYHDGIHWALEEGAMAGVGSGKFSPKIAVTRAQIVTMLYSLEGKPACDAALSFQDVPEGKWYTEAIRWAASQGIVAGQSAERFAPNSAATREQLVTILYSYARYKGFAVPAVQGDPLAAYNDADRVAGWAQEAFRWAVNAGIVSGTSADTMSPKKTATRAEIATMLRKLDQLR